MSDIFDTQFEGKEVELESNEITLGDEINLFEKDPSLRNILVGAGWDLNTFGGADDLDLDISVFLLDKDQMTRVDGDFIFYNQTEALDGAIKHNGDNRTGAGDGDDETISIDLQGIPFDILQVVLVLSIYKGVEKQQNVGTLRNAYVRIVNAENLFEICRYKLDEILEDKEETGVVIGYINREGPKWHFKPDAELIPAGLGEVARRYGLIINQE